MPGQKLIFFGFINLHEPSLAFIGTFIELERDGRRRVRTPNVEGEWSGGVMGLAGW